MNKHFLVYLFLFVASSLFSQNFDIQIMRSVHGHRNENLDAIFKTITSSYAVGSIGTPLTLYTIGLINKDSQLMKEALFIGESVAVSLFVTVALKETIKRNRPFETYPYEIERLTSAGGYSMPSGHTSTAFATATSLRWLIPNGMLLRPPLFGLLLLVIPECTWAYITLRMYL